jgi:hypothetical protein
MRIRVASRYDDCFEAGTVQIMFNALRHLFGCTHRKTTFPITPHHKLASSMAETASNSTYVVCLDCGKEFRYDWQEMRLGDPILARCVSGGR